MSTDLLNQAISFSKSGDKSGARRLLELVIDREPNNETAWIWMTDVVESGYERTVCLEKVLSINPNNLLAKEGLQRLALAKSPPPAPTTETERAVSSPNLLVTPGWRRNRRYSKFARAPSLTQATSRTVLPEIAGVLYLLLGAYWFIVGLSQVLLSSVGVAGTSAGVTDTSITGLWNTLISIVYFIIAVSIFRRSYRGYDWGLASAILSIPLVLLTGGLSCLTILSLLGYTIVAIFLWMARAEFRRLTK